MLNKILFYTLLALIVYLISSCETKSGPYIDGVYKGSSQSEYTAEPYWGNVIITIKNGYISEVDFQVVDSAKKEVFSDKYERHFADNAVYMEQCRNDWKGIQDYPKELVAKQSMDSVDVVSGATWSFNILKAAIQEALKDAKRKKD